MRTSVPKHPETPDVKQICSKRSFDGQVKKWRRELHFWDPEEDDGLEPVMVSVTVTSSVRLVKLSAVHLHICCSLDGIPSHLCMRSHSTWSH